MLPGTMRDRTPTVCLLIKGVDERRLKERDAL
jgi:hypothetical protein